MRSRKQATAVLAGMALAGGLFAATASTANGEQDPAAPGAPADPRQAGYAFDNVTMGGADGLWHSTDAGETFTRVRGIQPDNIGFGAPAPDATAPAPALYSSGVVGGVHGIHRSDDSGETWQRINDDQHQWAYTGAAITGDPDVYGRVSIGTNGRGVSYGDPTGG